MIRLYRRSASPRTRRCSRARLSQMTSSPGCQRWHRRIAAVSRVRAARQGLLRSWAAGTPTMSLRGCRDTETCGRSRDACARAGDRRRRGRDRKPGGTPRAARRSGALSPRTERHRRAPCWRIPCRRPASPQRHLDRIEQRQRRRRRPVRLVGMPMAIRRRRNSHRRVAIGVEVRHHMRDIPPLRLATIAAMRLDSPKFAAKANCCSRVSDCRGNTTTW